MRPFRIGPDQIRGELRKTGREPFVRSRRLWPARGKVANSINALQILPSMRSATASCGLSFQIAPNTREIAPLLKPCRRSADLQYASIHLRNTPFGDFAT